LKKVNKIGIILFVLIVVGYIIPQKYYMPVEGATKSDYNKDSFWHYPWGKSITHKGVDIFAKKGTPVHSSTIGLVLYAGKYGKGGKFVITLGPKWRLHYYAHLNTIETKALSFVTNKTMIGTVVNTGNAERTPPHLHYSIATIIPYPWRIDKEKQGYLKMFYLNPTEYL
jgi:murein DD-endopeptidase MepM/ murein hydrolase activator NlpD